MVLSEDGKLGRPDQGTSLSLPLLPSVLSLALSFLWLQVPKAKRKAPGSPPTSGQGDLVSYLLATLPTSPGTAPGARPLTDKEVRLEHSKTTLEREILVQQGNLSLGRRFSKG